MGEQILEDYLSIPLRRYPHDIPLPRAWDLRRNFTVYEAIYLALAELLEAPLLTADRALASQDIGPGWNWCDVGLSVGRPPIMDEPASPNTKIAERSQYFSEVVDFSGWKSGSPPGSIGFALASVRSWEVDGLAG